MLKKHLYSANNIHSFLIEAYATSTYKSQRIRIILYSNTEDDSTKENNMNANNSDDSNHSNTIQRDDFSITKYLTRILFGKLA